MKICPVEPSCSIWLDRWTDMRKLTLAFRNFANTPKKHANYRRRAGWYPSAVNAFGTNIPRTSKLTIFFGVHSFLSATQFVYKTICAKILLCSGCVISEVLRSVKINMTVFWDMMPCTLLARFQCFGRTWCFQFHITWEAACFSESLIKK
jgi:hypothetical protein